MPSQFFGLNIGMKSLNAFQAAISATANNIANVQTEGYSRQTAKLQSSEAMRVHATYGSAGTGVDVVEIKQERDIYYDEQYWKNQSSVGYFEKRLYYINQIEATLADDSVQEGFSTIFNKVFNALDTLNGGNASDESMRNQFIHQMQALCTYFNSVSTSLTDLQKDCNEEILNATSAAGSSNSTTVCSVTPTRPCLKSLVPTRVTILSTRRTASQIWHHCLITCRKTRHSQRL